MTQKDQQSYDHSLYPIHNRLFFRLFQLGNSLDRQCVNELGISSVHWAVLGALSRPQTNSVMSFTELTEYLDVSRQNLDGVLKRLEREGYVIRQIDKTDRRAKNIMLTKEGIARWEQLQENIYNFYKQALNGFTLDDMITFTHLANKLTNGLNDIKING
ncbi:MarR family winged helix-turn-helix transcriptional regulator [Acinetobacter oleivorans]|uniref:MarR family winged helix-turn-helix transcriptional regulator n=1 Tax=Acinetobacter oleivorans TaxID=1148157 RepID=UPI0011A4E3D9|nr:MarR family transcriptional regulator [Acinetobacter oleivorans]